jgi:protease-4
VSNEVNTIIVPKPDSTKKTSKFSKSMMIFGIILGLFILAGIGLSFLFSGDDSVEVKMNSILVVSFSETLNEYTLDAGPFSESSSASFLDVLQALKNAKNDPLISGIYIKAAGTPLGFAKLEEIIEAIKDFKKSKKFIYAFVETGSKSDYLLASYADSIFMPKEGLAEIQAPGASVMFYKGILDKMGISVHVEQFEEYKSAGETFSKDKFSQPAKEEIAVILQARSQRMYQLISTGRNIPIRTVQEAFDRGVYASDSLLSLHFIDGIAQETEVKEKIKRKIESINLKKSGSSDKIKNLSMISLSEYSEAKNAYKNPSKAPENQQIAIVNGVGAIRSGKSGGSNPFDQGTMEIASSSMASDIRKAKEDNNIKAIILRIDSPGGSVIASDELWNEIKSAKKVKPVYASMSDVAASGGYYIPMACDTIIAHPQTITGSIGVIAMIPYLSGTLNKLGITIDTLSTGASSQDMNVMMPMTERSQMKLKSQMYPIYQRFVQKVADSRKMTFDQARSLAKGRVWLGNDAKNNKLVDTLGGLSLAISMAKKRIGIPDSTDIIIKSYPEKKDFIEELLSTLTKTKNNDEVHILSNKSAFMSFVSEVITSKMLPHPIHQQLALFWNIVNVSSKEKVLLTMPYIPMF